MRAFVTVLVLVAACDKPAPPKADEPASLAPVHAVPAPTAQQQAPVFTRYTTLPKDLAAYEAEVVAFEAMTPADSGWHAAAERVESSTRAIAKKYKEGREFGEDAKTLFRRQLVHAMVRSAGVKLSLMCPNGSPQAATVLRADRRSVWMTLQKFWQPFARSRISRHWASTM